MGRPHMYTNNCHPEESRTKISYIHSTECRQSVFNWFMIDVIRFLFEILSLRTDTGSTALERHRLVKYTCLEPRCP